jgi:hypothetical protein
MLANLNYSDIVGYITNQEGVMKRVIIVIIVLAVIFMGLSYFSPTINEHVHKVFNQQEVIGNNKVATKHYSLAPFKKVEGDDIIHLKVNVGALKQSISVKAESNILPYIHLLVKRGRFYAFIPHSVSLQNHEPIDIILNLPKLHQFILKDTATGDVTNIRNSTFVAELYNASKASFQGATKTFNVTSVDSSILDAAKLKANDVNIQVEDASRASIQVLDKLSTMIADSAILTVNGSAVFAQITASGNSKLDGKNFTVRQAYINAKNFSHVVLGRVSKLNQVLNDGGKVTVLSKQGNTQ